MSSSSVAAIFAKGNHAVITGAASGIGLAAAKACAAAGMKVVLADMAGERLESARLAVAGVAADPADIAAIATDVSELSQIEALEKAAIAKFGPVHFLMNNAGIQPGSAMFGPLQDWQRVIAVNLWGVIHGSRVFGPGMISHGAPGMIVNTGSKQGITTPPGDPAYNTAKAGVKVFTESLQHELRNIADCRITAHLLVPGFVFTALTSGHGTQKPAAAWTAEQTVDFMLESLARGDFYIICPDNDVPRSLDEKRMAWAIGDIIENRPPLSRWHPDYADAFKASLTKDTRQ